MTLVDANLLIYSTDRDSPFYERALDWLTEQLNGNRRVGIPWLSIGAFLRISTHPRHSRPLTTEEAWGQVHGWLSADMTWTPAPGPGHAGVLREILLRHHVAGDLVTDAQLAALAVEHGLTIYSADTDFARFAEARWVNPIAPRA